MCRHLNSRSPTVGVYIDTPMDDFEWIEKDELIERKNDAVQAPELCHVPEAVSGTAHDMPTQEVEMTPPSGVTEDEQPAEEYSAHEVPPRPSVQAAVALQRALSCQGF